MKRTTKNLLLILAFGLPFGLFLLTTLAAITAIDRFGIGFPLALAGPTVVFAVPTFYFLSRRRLILRKERAAQTLVAVVKSYGQITLGDLAERMGKTEGEMELTLMEAVADGYLQGFIDPDARTFYYGRQAPEYEPVVAKTKKVEVPIREPTPPPDPSGEVRFCRECGHRVEWIAQEGRWRCPSCGNVQL
ncbi:MAG: PCI domain-containing protein [Thermoplasmata archaeon]